MLVGIADRVAVHRHARHAVCRRREKVLVEIKTDGKPLAFAGRSRQLSPTVIAAIDANTSSTRTGPCNRKPAIMVNQSIALWEGSDLLADRQSRP